MPESGKEVGLSVATAHEFFGDSTVNQTADTGRTISQAETTPYRRKGGAIAGFGLGTILFLAAAILFFTPPTGDEVSADNWTMNISCASAAFGDDRVQGNAPRERFDGLSTDLQMTCMTGRQQHSGTALLLTVLGSASLIIGATRRP